MNKKSIMALAVAFGITSNLLTLPSSLDVSPFRNRPLNIKPALEERVDLRTGKKIMVENSKLEEYHEWKKSTVDWSKKCNDYALVVNKAERELTVYYNGTAIDSFLVGLSPRPIGHKLYGWDLHTPEGLYGVYEKKAKSVFYKSLMINYPNPSDRIRFSENKKNGLIPEKKVIGSNIAIHGAGNERDWTYGCIALSNQDMDRLFLWAKFCTPVTIIGYE